MYIVPNDISGSKVLKISANSVINSVIVADIFRANTTSSKYLGEDPIKADSYL